MPKSDIDYSKCIIYKIVSLDLSLGCCYVGHTTNFKQRKSQHKSACKSLEQYNLYEYIRNNGDWDNFQMILVEKYPCKDINDATARERYWYEILNANLNTKVPNRTKKEYTDLNKEENNIRATNHYYANHEQSIQVRKEYYKKNKESINEKRNNTLIECACGMSISISNYQRHLKRKIHLDNI